MQKAFVAWLGPCQEQVRCSVGRADVVDKTWVYELKTGCRSSFSAVGQAVLYATALKRKPCVVLDWEANPTYRDALKDAGVALIVFKDGEALEDTRWDHEVAEIMEAV